ncbi:hypothetical protein, partial [Sphingomonas bacterium]|uniref:hypothetical protein n=1 Tax=Sphingomonas bacterium TaxID=1895847 RepID=UPI001C2D1DE4
IGHRPDPRLPALEDIVHLPVPDILHTTRQDGCQSKDSAPLRRWGAFMCNGSLLPFVNMQPEISYVAQEPL